MTKKVKLRGISRGRKVATYFMNRNGPAQLTDAQIQQLIGTNLNNAAPDVARTTLALLPKGSQMNRSSAGVWSYQPPPASRPR